MNHSMWNKQIPTLLALVVIVFGVLVTTYLVESGVIYTGRASQSTTPQDIKITNITDNSFTVSYTTTQETPGIVSFGKDTTLGQNALDERDSRADSFSPYTSHHITVKNLTPNTQYYFSIVNGGSTYLNNGAPYQTATAGKLNSAQTIQKKLQGVVILPNGEKVSEGLVYLSSPNSQDISTRIQNGEYVLDLSNLRNKNLDSSFQISDTTIFTLKAVGKDGQSQITLFAKNSTVPIITLSQNYDFTISEDPILQPLSSEIGGGLPQELQLNQTTGTPQITVPKKNEEFIDQRPQFKGTAVALETVSITIRDENIVTQVKADSSGNWLYRPTRTLIPGSHTITISAKDKTGVLRTATQSFTIFSLGTRVAQTATPSASPTIGITATPTPIVITPTVIPTQLVTPTPTIVVPTLLPTSTPIIFPTPTTVVVIPSKTEPPGNELVVFGGMIAFATTAIGLLLYLVTHWTTL